MIQFSIFTILIALSMVALLNKDFNLVSDFAFYSLIVIIVLDYIEKKSITLFQTWHLAFLFIIISEALLIIDPTPAFLKALRYLIIANNVVIIGYLSYPEKPIIRIKRHFSVRSFDFPVILFVILICIYVYFTLPEAIKIFAVGRVGVSEIIYERDNVFLSSFMHSIGFILPAIIAFFYREVKMYRSIIVPFILCIPIFGTMLIAGTRFPLLFSFGGFIIISFANRIKGKVSLNLKYVAFVLLLFLSSVFMKSYRAFGYGGGKLFSFGNNPDTRLTAKIASNMSPEGVIDMTTLMMDYFNNNSHTHGSSISFLAYFWIPRTVWPEKPTMLGHWLIREYREGFSSGHSASFGFTGELYADFGYFSLIIIFFMGILLRKADEYLEIQLSHPGSYQKIFAAMLFPYVFFFVRSPITSTMTFFGIVVVYYVLKKLMLNEFHSNWVMIIPYSTKVKYFRNKTK